MFVSTYCGVIFIFSGMFFTHIYFIFTKTERTLMLFKIETISLLPFKSCLSDPIVWKSGSAFQKPTFMSTAQETFVHDSLQQWKHHHVIFISTSHLLCLLVLFQNPIPKHVILAVLLVLIAQSSKVNI